MSARLNTNVDAVFESIIAQLVGGVSNTDGDDEEDDIYNTTDDEIGEDLETLEAAE